MRGSYSSNHKLCMIELPMGIVVLVLSERPILIGILFYTSQQLFRFGCKAIFGEVGMGNRFA